MNYPETYRDVNIKDDYFGTIVYDPYRWLEEYSTETKEWIIRQHNFTENFLSKIPLRDKINKRLVKLYNYESYGLCKKAGNYIYFFKNNGTDNQEILYRQKNNNGISEKFFDPNILSKDGTISISGITFSPDGKYMSYLESKAGSDWNTIKIMDTESCKELPDKIEWIKFSQPQWTPHGFYYTAYSRPEGNEYSDLSISQKIYFHRLGTETYEDTLVFGENKHPYRYYHPHISEDMMHLIVIVSEGTRGDEILIIDLINSKTKTLINGFKFDYKYISCIDNQLLVLTNDNAPNGRIIEINLTDNSISEIIGEKDLILIDAIKNGEKIIVNYLQNVSNILMEYNSSDEILSELFIPEAYSTIVLHGSGSQLFFSVKNFISPPVVYLLKENGKAEIFKTSVAKINANEFITEQIFFKSADNTLIPMFISYKKGTILNGDNLVHLYGYGGFNISMTPEFTASNIFLMEQGGIYAVANIRGGGEYGESWHKQGMLGNKQKVFDDFISATEYLIENKYTSSEKLVISGGSNGGLLVGACITQRPELFAVAIPRVGVLDMLRFQKFTVGWGWIPEYGSSENEEDFKYLFEYSPLHNIKKQSYPPTLIMTADHDDRVVPAHSFKFAAELQHCQQGDNPIIIRIDRNSGHGAGKARKKIIEEMTDMYAFIFYHTGIKI